MHATKVYYKKLINTGNFSNIEIGIEVSVEPGESASDAVNHAKNFIQLHDPTFRFDIQQQQDLFEAKRKEMAAGLPF